MNLSVANLNQSDREVETIAAELTEAAFPVALGHGVGDDWLDYRLELWNALQGAVAQLIDS